MWGKVRAPDSAKKRVRRQCIKGLLLSGCKSHRKLGAVFSKILIALKTRRTIWRRRVGFEPCPPNEDVGLAKGPKRAKGTDLCTIVAQFVLRLFFVFIAWLLLAGLG
jgi:hypothetical protein